MESNLDQRRAVVKKTKRLMIIVLAINWAMATIKLLAGIASGSLAVMSDSIESYADGASNIVGYIALSISGKKEDTKHPYGHWKYETYATTVIAGLLFIAGCSIFATSFHKIFDYFTYGTIEPVDSSPIIIIVMVISIIVNFLLVKWEKRKAREYKSTILMADSAHTATDVMITAVVIASLLLANIMPMFDPVVSFFISLIIFKTAIGLFGEIDRTLGDKMRIDAEEIEHVASLYPEVVGINCIRTRGSESAIFLDFTILVNPELTIKAVHDIQDSMEEEIKRRNEFVIDVIIHAEPAFCNLDEKE